MLSKVGCYSWAMRLMLAVWSVAAGALLAASAASSRAGSKNFWPALFGLLLSGLADLMMGAGAGLGVGIGVLGSCAGTART